MVFSLWQTPWAPWDPQTLKWVLWVFHRLRIETFFSSIILCFSCEQTWFNSNNWTSKISSRKKCIWGRERFSSKILLFSICFYLVLPLPSREGIQCNSFAHIMASGGLFLLVFDRYHLFTNGINCLSAESTEPEQIQTIWVSHFQSWLFYSTWLSLLGLLSVEQVVCMTSSLVSLTYS